MKQDKNTSSTTTHLTFVQFSVIVIIVIIVVVVWLLTCTFVCMSVKSELDHFTKTATILNEWYEHEHLVTVLER